MRRQEAVDVRLQLVRERTGVDVAVTRAQALSSLEAQGLVRRAGLRLVATPAGRNVLDTVLGLLAEPDA